MLSTVELLDLAKERQGGATDYRLSKLLEVSTQHISHYRHKGTTPSNPVAMRLAELCGLDPAEVVAWVNLERTSSETERKVWEMMLARVEASKGLLLAA